MKKLIIAISLLVSTGLSAQTIHRSQWTVQPKVSTTSYLASGVLQCIEQELIYMATEGMDDNQIVEFWEKNGFYIPEVYWTFPLQHLSAPDGAKVSHPFWWRELLLGDFSHSFKFNAGYELSWKSLVSPFGAFVGVEWEYNHLRLKNGNEAGAHYSQAIVPNAGLRFRIWGGNFERPIKPSIEISGSYVYHFNYHNDHHYDKDALNNGFRGRIGAGVNFNNRMTILLQYEQDFFNYFNKDYTPDDGATHPFDGYKTHFGSISLRFSHSF